MSSTWSSGVGKFLKKDPNHGRLGRRIRHWFCKVGLCNLHCGCDCHEEKCCDHDDVVEQNKKCCKKKKTKLVKKWEGSRMVTKEIEVDE